ncbi:MAG: hypothetical protein N3B18_01685 [Desulfobacterota bacterium]|nr:hypothetical protein [Thermodesulfobacteriota bacterium]
MKSPLTVLNCKAEILSCNKKGDGTHRVLKITDNGAPLVLKCYGRTRSRLEYVLKLCGIRLLVGKTSTSARGRMATERSVLGLLSREGVSAPKILSWNKSDTIRQPFLALEWIAGTTLAEIVRSPQYSLNAKKDLLFRCGTEMRERHDRAIRLREPRLVFEHPSLHHVIVSNGRLVHTDFEIAYCRKNDIERLARREIAGFLYSLARAHWPLFPPLFTAFTEGYRHPRRLNLMLAELRRYGTIPVAGWLTRLPFIFRIKRRHRRIAAAARTVQIPQSAHLEQVS